MLLWIRKSNGKNQDKIEQNKRSKKQRLIAIDIHADIFDGESGHESQKAVDNPVGAGIA